MELLYWYQVSLYSAVSSITEQCHLTVFCHVHVEVSEVRVHCSSELSKINVYPIHIAFSFIHIYSTNNPTWDLYCTNWRSKAKAGVSMQLIPLFMLCKKELKLIDSLIL